MCEFLGQEESTTFYKENHTSTFFNENTMSYGGKGRTGLNDTLRILIVVFGSLTIAVFCAYIMLYMQSRNVNSMNIDTSNGHEEDIPHQINQYENVEILEDSRGSTDNVQIIIRQQ